MTKLPNQPRTLATVILVVILNGLGQSGSNVHVDLSLDLVNVIQNTPSKTGSGGQN